MSNHNHQHFGGDHFDYSQFDFTNMQRDLDVVKSKVFRRPDAAFFGPLLCSLDFSWLEEVRTAATDGKTLWWAPSDFVRCRDAGLGEDVSTLMHELWHNARMHDLRRGNRCPDVWNVACDVWINRELKKAGYYVGPDWVLCPEFDNVELEEDIYDLLLKQGGGGSGPSGNQGGSAGSQSPGQQGQHGHCSHQSAPAQTDPQTLIGNVVKAVQAAKMAGQPGAIPGSTEMIVDRFLSPVIPWEKHLYDWMSDLLEEDYTWRRPDRRHQEVYLPSRYEEDGRLEHLVYFQDVSGSITDHDILRFNSELKFVWDTFKPRKMTIAQFDTQIQKVDEFEEGDPYEKIRIVGRGGTDLACVREMIEELRPTAAIVFSDMQVSPMRQVDVPVLWVAVDSGWGIGHTPTFGKVIRLKDDRVVGS